MITHEFIQTAGHLPVFITTVSGNQHFVPSHWHHHIEVLYIKEGALKLDTPTSSFVLKKDSLFIVNSEEIHMTRNNMKTHYLLLQIPIALLEQSIPNHQNVRYEEMPSSNLTIEKLPYYNQLVKNLNAMYAIYSQQQDGYALSFNRYLYTFLDILYTHFRLQQAHQNLPYGKHHQHIKKAMEYIDLNCNNPLTIQDIAGHLALNPEYFCRLFKKNTGNTVMEYVNQVRLSRFYDELLHSKQTITTLQNRYGFTNHKALVRLFRERYGSTPSEFRKHQIS